MILLAEHDEPSLAAKKKRQHVALETATSTPKNRVWNFFGSAPGRISCEPDLSWETATGSVQFSYETASGQAYYYTRDHLGSVREMCSSTGAIVARYGYDPYGRTTLVSGSNLASKQYAGMYMHQTSGLYLTRAGDGSSTGRPFDPATGRCYPEIRLVRMVGLTCMGMWGIIQSILLIPLDYTEAPALEGPIILRT